MVEHFNLKSDGSFGINVTREKAPQNPGEPPPPPMRFLNGARFTLIDAAGETLYDDMVVWKPWRHAAERGPSCSRSGRNSRWRRSLRGDMGAL